MIDRNGRQVISDLSFQLDPGNALILRGANGVGKSSLLRGLAGLLRVEGEISTTPEEISYAGHLDALKSALTVRQNLEIWAGLSGATSLLEATETFALTPLLDQPVHVCSAGQKRRAGLARLVLEARPVWLMDEPTTALDETACKQVQQAIRTHLSRKGIALIATHIELGIKAETLTLTAPNVNKNGSPIETDPFLSGNFA